MTIPERIESGEIELSEWVGLYREKWNGLIVPAATAHPAKFSRALIRAIYDHTQAEGWLEPGTVVLDPFGGVALGAFEAMRHGCRWVGVELEPRFVDLGEQNLARWNQRFAGKWPGWGEARLVQGDSRRLAGVLGEAGLLVSSPPFNENRANAKHGETKGYHSYGENEPYNRMKRDYVLASDPANLGNLKASDAEHAAVLISSPPYVAPPGHDSGHPRLDAAEDARREAEGCARRNGYGTTDGNISAMKEGDQALVISSPPFVESLASDDPDKRGGLFRDERRRNDRTLTATYGESPGQLGAMKAGELIVTSPPYEHRSYEGMSKSFAEWREMQGRDNNKPGAQGVVRGYGQTEGQMAGSDTFWSAARTILAECHAVLAPDSKAIFVVKDFVRAKRRVPFSLQWAELAEACGFRLTHWHRALLTEHHGVQLHADGSDREIKTERISFFRRLAQKKGSPVIDAEDVLCFVRV